MNMLACHRGVRLTSLKHHVLKDAAQGKFKSNEAKNWRRERWGKWLKRTRWQAGNLKSKRIITQVVKQRNMINRSASNALKCSQTPLETTGKWRRRNSYYLLFSFAPICCLWENLWIIFLRAGGFNFSTLNPTWPRKRQKWRRMKAAASKTSGWETSLMLNVCYVATVTEIKHWNLDTEI